MKFSLHTFPTLEQLERQAEQTPSHMRPNTLPLVVIGEGFLELKTCHAIINEMLRLEPYSFPTCGAKTREAPRPLPDCIRPVVDFAEMINDIAWMYELDPDPDAWMQTYSVGGEYHEHMDYSPGQSRKLTAVALLSDPDDYEGGDLQFNFGQLKLDVPPTRGTIAVFPATMMHHVTTIEKGFRETLNVGFYGPQFR